MNEKQKIISFCYLSGEYLTIFESLLNNMSILNSRVLTNIRFSTHWETESVTAETIVI